MKKFLLGTAALIALGVPAMAADMGVRPMARPAPYFSWTGCYVGPYIGYATGRSQFVSEPGSVDIATNGVSPLTGVSGAVPGGPVPGATITPKFNLGGMIGGGTAGCQYQAGVWVFGIEGDGGPSDKEGQANGLRPFNPSGVHQTNERWIATLRGRLGYAVDKWLFYATGGAAWAGVEATAWRSCFQQAGVTQCPDGGTIEPGGGVPSIHDKKTMFGYAVGGGVEYALGYGWSIKSEYIFLQFKDKDFFAPPGSITCCAIGTLNGQPVGTFASPQRVSLYDHTFKWGLNYKFDSYLGKAPMAMAVTK